nr:uncharacterized protein LOC129385819 [Dermacentor andersoni]
MPGCCVPQCSNHSRNGWRMFHFPRDPKRRLLWLVRVKRDKWQPTNSSCVCSAHFEASSFEQNRADGWKKLKPNAVPTVFPFKELPKERRPPRERNAHVPALFSDDAAAHNSSREVRNVLPSTTQEFSPADSSSDGEINERLAATETNNANGQLTSTPRDARLQETAIVTATQPLDSEAAELRKKIADLTAANNKLRQHHNESKNTVKKLQMQVRKLQKEATNFSRNTKFLNEDQIRALSRNNNHGNSWSAQTVKQGLKIKFACGTTGYETLRKIGYPLPSSRTLARRIQGLKFLPGILHEVIDVMRSKAEGMEDVEKDCVLFLDEMEIAPGFELDRGEDVLLGGTTLPSKPEEPANHALVFMLGGRLPADCGDKVRDFHRFVIRIREDKKFLLSQIGNADQTPINFDMPRNSTVDMKGAKSVQVKTTGAEKQRCTVMLAVTADGRKLPPFVVFKRKTLPKGTLPAGIHIRAQEKGWMSAELVSDWLKTVWGRRPGALLLPSLLVMDSFGGHLEKNVRCRMSELRTDLAIIPGGLTSVLQPLDVSINKPFKDNVRRLYTEWMAAGNHDLTPAGKIRRPTIDMLCRWILEAWSVIPSEMVVRSFKKTGISNSLDGSEDDALWEDDDADEVASDMSGSVDSDSEPE